MKSLKKRKIQQTNIADLVLDAIKDSQSVGISPRQISIKTGVSKSVVLQEIAILTNRGDVLSTGCRDLYVVSEFAKIPTSDFHTPAWYMKRFEKENKIHISNRLGSIRFIENIQNGGKRIHRWSPYVQGFSESFVENMFGRYKIVPGKKVGDPLLGSGTVAVCAKIRGIYSLGVDVNPLMVFMSKAKTNWDIDTFKAQEVVDKIIDRAMSNQDEKYNIPFLKETRAQFKPKILEGLLALKTEIERASIADEGIENLIRLAFASILIDCSKLWRAPGLGYTTEKRISKGAPYDTFRLKLAHMLEDLRYVQSFKNKWGTAEIVEGDARTYQIPKESLDIIITSPPYVNGIDYVLNYKIELAWLSIAKSYKELQAIRSAMIVCDNTARGEIKEFTDKYGSVKVDGWLDEIVTEMGATLKKKGICRRTDMHMVVKKYFVDLIAVMQRAYFGLKKGGRFVFVMGDSLMSGSYIPADLILARIGKKIGFKIESIEIARERRSGQKRDFILRESIVSLLKCNSKKPQEILS